jgi:hypothetical protein
MARFSPRLAAAAGLLLLTGCGTTHPLPKYEKPLARTTFQTVRTTAYTHTEADHVQYGARNALGGRLRAAGRPGLAPIAPPAPVAAALPISATTITRSAPGEPPNDAGGFHRAAYAPPVPMAPAVAPSLAPRPTYVEPAEYGSAAADWSRWPAGTVFQILSTGQLYKVDDYGWALSGRNTIDLYLPSRSAMNRWGVRSEAIQILRWGDSDASLRILRPREKYRHIRRMVLELEGNHGAAARMH